MHLIGVPTIFLACLATTVSCDDMQIKWCSDTDGKGVCSEGIANFDACYQIPDSRAEDEAIRQGHFGGSFTVSYCFARLITDTVADIVLVYQRQRMV